MNVLVGREEYVYTYDVRFTNDCTNVRFGMLIKTMRGVELGGASTATRIAPIKQLHAGEVITVAFRFRCLLLPGMYFLNAGVLGMVGEAEVYLDRHIDAVAFRVLTTDASELATTIVDFCIEPMVSMAGVDGGQSGRA